MTAPPIPPRIPLFQRKGPGPGSRSGSAAGAPGGEQDTGPDDQSGDDAAGVECQCCGATIDRETGDVLSMPDETSQPDMAADVGGPPALPPDMGAAMGGM